MANFNAAFGYDFYIVPLMSSAVDVTFAGVTSGISDSGGFIDTTTVVPATDQSIVFIPGTSSTDPKFTVESVDYLLDGAGNPVRLAGLTQASLETDTGSEDIYTYDDETKGFNQAVATTKGFTISLAGIADFADSGYKFLRLTETNTVSDSLRVKLVRVGPTGVAETVYGYGTLMGYTESNEVSSIVSWECSISGYGPYQLDLADNAQLTGGIASLDNFATQTAFDTTSASGVPVTLSGNATGTATTLGNGDLANIAIISGGSGYQVGDTVTITEDGGAGEATAEVSTLL